MNPVWFREQNQVTNKGMRKYDYMPSHSSDIEVLTCWRLSFWERVWLLFSGYLWARLLKGQLTNSVILQLEKPEFIQTEGGDYLLCHQEVQTVILSNSAKKKIEEEELCKMKQSI